ncbi:MAG: hypothetical protein ACJA09_000375 [Alcanivorax sp.]
MPAGDQPWNYYNKGYRSTAAGGNTIPISAPYTRVALD